MPSNILNVISQHATQHEKSVFYIHSIGFYSHFTVQLPSAFPIVDTHPDPASTQDLRLLSPWSELLTFAEDKTKNLQEMDDEQHGHVPYVLLLLHYLQQWKAENGGQVPDNYKEKAAFRDMVRNGARTKNAEGGEENFDEAVAAVLKSLNPAVPTSAVKEVLTAPECAKLDQKVVYHYLNRMHRTNHLTVLRFLGHSSCDQRLLRQTFRSASIRLSTRHES